MCEYLRLRFRVSLHLSVAQVLDWVEQHGEVFLNKHTGVGKSLHRARALQKRHDDFQQVAQVPQVYTRWSFKLGEVRLRR